MPITKSAIKAMKQANAAKTRNQAVKADFRIKVKEVKKALTSGAKDVDKLISTAVQALDKAAKRNVIHKTAADRRKSRLMLLVNKTQGKAVVPATLKEKTKEVAKPKATKKTTTTKKTTKKAS